MNRQQAIEAIDHVIEISNQDDWQIVAGLNHIRHSPYLDLSVEAYINLKGGDYLAGIRALGLDTYHERLGGRPEKTL